MVLGPAGKMTQVEVNFHPFSLLGNFFFACVSIFRKVKDERHNLYDLSACALFPFVCLLL